MVSNIQTYSTDIYFAQKWQDSRLSFPYITSDYRVLDVEWLQHIWRPDTFFRNAKSIRFGKMTTPNHYLWVYRNNTIMHTMKLGLKLFCAMDFALYPHDMQKCSIQIESSKLTPMAYFSIVWQNELGEMRFYSIFLNLQLSNCSQDTKTNHRSAQSSLLFVSPSFTV